MATNKVNSTPEGNQAVGEAVTGVESWLKKHGNLLSTIILVVLVAVCAALALNRWMLKPAKQEAMAASAGACNYFNQSLYEQALNGDGNVLGFADVIAQYGKKAGQGVYYQAGVCQLQLKNYTEAVSYLKQYKGSDPIMKGRALCCIGDAQVGLGDNASALNSYKAAAKADDTILSAGYLLKAGIAAEDLGKSSEALSFYNEIKVKYPNTIEAIDIDKYISRIENVQK